MTTDTERPPTYALAGADSQMVISRKPIALFIGSWDEERRETSWGPGKDGVLQEGIIWRVRMTCFAVRGTKDRPTLTYGVVGTSGVQADWRHEEIPGGPTEFMAGWDNRYGVDALATWDGESLWSKSSRWADMVEMHRILEVPFRNLPDVPPACTGWWLQPRRSK